MFKIRLVYLCGIILTFMPHGLAAGLEPVVNRQLAVQRKEAVSGVGYNLSLTIDSLNSVETEGRIQITFDY